MSGGIGPRVTIKGVLATRLVIKPGMGHAGDGVIITQVTPHFDADLPLMVSYRKAIRTYAPEASPSFGSMEGYIATRILSRALERIEGPITRESVIDSLEKFGEFDIGLGEKLRLGPEEHQACHRVWPTILRQGKVAPFKWEELRTRP
ncbi:MAG: ABC transporter substrate-binding protein [Deltaproteobacteria bacterium]|nr:ABC transporter substrate-binding protein [Deltaproteobacteria bacterium]